MFTYSQSTDMINTNRPVQEAITSTKISTVELQIKTVAPYVTIYKTGRWIHSIGIGW